MKALPIVFILIICGCIDCSSSHISFVPVYSSGPPTLVYKTRADYSNNVPIILSDDKTKILAFPDPVDVFINGKYPTPTQLKDGYLLDNRGISKNVAFLKMTYTEYARLPKPPTAEEMFAMIIDKEPLTELCNCGNRNAIQNPKQQMNQLIRHKQLRTVCKVIK